MAKDDPGAGLYSKDYVPLKRDPTVIDDAGNGRGGGEMPEIINEPSFDQPASKPIPRKW